MRQNFRIITEYSKLKLLLRRKNSNDIISKVVPSSFFFCEGGVLYGKKPKNKEFGKRDIEMKLGIVVSVLTK
ncbi:MAG: hypothetical protein K5888_11920 [Lachnospiraceae bacterium]|nr:hypothetical protein [Lachnospiraceae bacterium]